MYALFVGGAVRYIGKGHGNRLLAHVKEVERRERRRAAGEKLRPHFLYDQVEFARLAALPLTFSVLKGGLSDSQARELETLLIRVYGRTRFDQAGTLWNLEAGGQGFSPETVRMILSDPERVERIRAASRGRQKTPAELQAISDGVKAAFASSDAMARAVASRTGRKASAEHKANIARSMAGLKRSAETRAKVAAAARGRKPSEASKAKQIATLKAVCSTPEAKERLSRASRSKGPISEETRAAMSLARKAYWQRRREQGAGNGSDGNSRGP